MRDLMGKNIDVPGIMKLMESSGGPIDVSSWYDGDLGMHLTYALRGAFNESPPDLTFPIVYDGPEHSDGRGGKAPDDPVMMYVSLPLGGDESNGCEITYGCSLEGAVDDLIDGFSVSGRVTNESSRDICSRVAVRLRELADKLDEVCKPELELVG